MVTKQQLMSAVVRFINNDMLPSAATKDAMYRFILRGAVAYSTMRPEKAFDLIITKFPIVKTLEFMDDSGNVDNELLAYVIPEALANETFQLHFSAPLEKEPYAIGINADDVRKIMSYL